MVHVFHGTGEDKAQWAQQAPDAIMATAREAAVSALTRLGDPSYPASRVPEFTEESLGGLSQGRRAQLIGDFRSVVGDIGGQMDLVTLRMTGPAAGPSREWIRARNVLQAADFVVRCLYQAGNRDVHDDLAGAWAALRDEAAAAGEVKPAS